MKEKRIFKRALITGISGSGGSYLAEHIVNNYKDVEVHGIARWHSTTTSNNLENISNNVTIHECDLNDFSSILNVLKVVKPDVIFHLASHANVRAGFITPLSVIENNVMGTSNLYEAIRSADLDPIIQHCSTSEVYGQVDPLDIPIKENCPLRPTSPYAVSKTTQDHLGFAYWKSYNMKIIRTRMFAYFNPRRADLFATSFARQVALIEAGKQKELLHGNLDSVRTMIDVRDAMSSYWEAALYCQPGEAYNIGGPKVITVGDFLNILKKMATTEIPTRINPDLLRPSDVTLQIPDISKFVAATNWEANYSFEESIAHLLDYWRERVI
jgi:GDPmannose 4,6-dehydratase/GDP-4-dehydro-6-deoxy-D-mannose reductase